MIDMVSSNNTFANNSMIFKTIDSSVDNTRKTLALFNKDWNTYKTNWQQGFSQNGVAGGIKSIFQSSNSNSVISKDQLQILRNWNNAVAHGCTNQETFNRIIKDADSNTKLYFSGLNKGKGSVKGLKNAQNVAKQSTIGLTLAQTALNAAISLGFTAALMLAVKGLDKLINSAKRASEAADEAFSDTTEKVQKNEEETKSLDELISKYKELKESENLDVDGRKEIKEIQNDIADLVGVQASNLDLVNGKLDDEIAKLDEISAKEAKNAYETATANYNNSKKATNKATGDDSFLFVDGYSYTGKREKEAEKVLKNAGFGGNVQSGGFFGNTLFVMDSFDNDMKELKGAQEKADYLQSMIDVLEQNGQRATDLYAGLISQRDKYLQYIDNQQDAANSLVNSWISYSQLSNDELSKINVDSLDSFEEYRQKMIEEAKNDESIGKMLADGTLSDEDLENAVNDFMATSTKFSTWYEQWIGNIESDVQHGTPIFSDIFSLKDANDTLTTLGKISESIDTIQNAYNTLNSAIEEYNNSGSISIDALQSIIALGDDWYDYLLDENGALKLDKESLQALTLSRLADMKAQIQQNMIDSVKKINDDASAKEYLASTNYKTADSIEAVTNAMIDQALAEKRLLVDSGDLSQENYDLIEKKLRGDIEKSNLLVSNISLDDISLSGGSSSSKSNSKSNSKDSIDIIDFAEEKLNHLNTLIDDTQKHIEQLEGSANKNALVDSLVDINKSKMDTLEQVSNLYTRMADEYLAKIPEQYKGLAKEGGLEIDKFIGDGNSEVTDAIKNYQTWADKVDDINSQLIELKQTLKDLEVDKFNNIKDDFDSMYGILDKNKSKIKDVVSLLETQEQNVGQGFYEELITETKSQIQILKEERDTLTSQMTSALRNGIEYGSNEWKDMYDALQDVDSSIISCENDLKDFQKSINELHWNTLEKIKDQFSSISSELDSLNGLLEKDTVTSNGKFTSESITRIGLLAQKYELARNEVAQYNKEIKYLENLYKNGKISINEYTDKLNELRDSQFSSISTAEEAKKAILDLAEARVNEAIDAINDETDAYEELINKQKDSLQAEKDLYEYKKNIAQKEKEISALKRKINAMMGSDDASTIAEREKLEAELAEAVNDLEDYKYDHSVEVRSDALDKELEDYKDAQDKRTEALKDSLKNENEVLNKAINEAKSRANEISNTLLTLERKQGITIASCIITPWRTGSSAIAGYNQALNSSTSNFTAKLNGIKTNIQSVQTQANNMASTIMSAFNISNNSGVYEAISKVRQNLYNTSVESIHLKQWISSALNSSYGNGAVNSINNVKDAANKAGNSVNGLRYEINQLSKSIPDLTTNMTAFATGAYAASSYKNLLDMIKRNEAKLSAQSGQGKLPSAGINNYLPFPMFAEGGVVNGKSNKLAQSFGEDVTIFAKKGERVLSLEQTKSFDKLVSNLPEITPKLEDFVKTFKLPQNNFTKVGSSTPIINIDAGITVQGNIDKNFAKEFENMQNQLTKNVTGKIATSLEKLGMQKNNCRPL